jgi:hypothetical protein
MNRLTILCLIPALTAFALADPSTRPASTAPASTTATGPTTRDLRIDKLIGTLSHDDWQTRQKAQDELVRLGAFAVPKLKNAAERGADDEIRERAAAALRIIEERRVSGPSSISLQFRNAHPREVFEELARQASTEFRFPPKVWEQHKFPAITIDIEAKPFWLALKQVCEASGMFPYPGYGGGVDHRMMLVPRGNTVFGPFSVISGPFLIVGQSVHRANTVNLMVPAEISREFSVQFTVYSEPKLHVTRYSGSLHITEAVDEKGNKITQMEHEDSMLSANPSNWCWSMGARLMFPINGGTRIARLRGNIEVEIQTRVETLRFDNVAAIKSPVVKNVAGHRYAVQKFARSGDQATVTLLISRDGRDEAEWDALSESLQTDKTAIILRDNKGNPWSYSHYTSDSDVKGLEVKIVYNRSDDDGDALPGDAAVLTWNIPQQVKQIQVPFDFRDLPIP